MMIEEKVGLLFIFGVGVNEDGSLEKSDKVKGLGVCYFVVIENIDNGKLNYFNVWIILEDFKMMVVWYNNLQVYVEKFCFGILVIIVFDFCYYFSNIIFFMVANGFMQFCEILGLVVIGNDLLVEVFVNIVCEEYLVVGLWVALYFQIDLVMEF